VGASKGGVEVEGEGEEEGDAPLVPATERVTPRAGGGGMSPGRPGPAGARPMQKGGKRKGQKAE